MNIPRKVTVLFPELYMVTRLSGGPEEGGWWWDHHELLKTFPPREIESQKDRDYLVNVVARLARFLNWSECRRPLSSVLSSGSNQGYAVEVPGSLVTRERPRYE